MTCIKRTNWVVEPIHDEEEAIYQGRAMPQDFDSIYGEQYSSEEEDDECYTDDEPLHHKYKAAPPPPPPAHQPTSNGSSRRRRTSVELAGGDREKGERAERGGNHHPHAPPSSRTARRSSVGGTTLYEFPHMAKVDSFLRESGLRLKTDGTCNFLFDHQRFNIETTDETGDFLFYACLGKLRELKKYHPDKNLLRLLAHWNEVQTSQHDGEAAGGEGECDNAGLLRIDSSKPDGPHVSFIYYGHIDEISCAKEFQMLLDRFVDDAIAFSFKLNPTLGGSDGGVEKSFRSSSQSVGSKSQRTQSTYATTSSQNSQGSDGSGSASVHYSPHSAHASSPAAPPSGNSSAASSSGHSNGNNANAGQGQGQGHGPGKKSVFTKMMKTLRKNNDNGVAAMAFIDPSNKSSPFVVDKNEVEHKKEKAPPASAASVGPAPTINLSRKGEKKKGSSFHVDDGRVRERPNRKGSSFHVDDRDHRHQRNRSSLLDEEYDRPARKGSSFHIDEYNDRPQQRKGSSFHVEHEGHHVSPQQRKCKSFHNSEDFNSSNRSSSGNNKPYKTSRRSTMNSECESNDSFGDSFNKSYDVFNRSDHSDVNRSHEKSSSRCFANSEPCVSSRGGQHGVGITTTTAFKTQPIAVSHHPKSSSSRSSKSSSNPEHRRKTLTDLENPMASTGSGSRGSRTRRRGSAVKPVHRSDRSGHRSGSGGGSSKWGMDKPTFEDDDESDCSWDEPHHNQSDSLHSKVRVAGATRAA